MKKGTPAAMLRNIRAISLPDMAGDILEQTTSANQLKALNIDQMMHGKNNKGELFAPKHSESPFFKTPEAGMRYARWKQKLFPDSPFDIANFTITGYYHSSISFSRKGNELAVDASASFANAIEREYNNSTLGLNKESKATVWSDIVRPKMIRMIANRIGVEVK